MAKGVTIKSDLTFRKAGLKDAALLLEWRNDNLTCQNSISPIKVEPSNHEKWFNNILNSESHELYIVQSGDNPVGTIRFDRMPEDKWELSWTIAPDSREKGYGKLIVQEAVKLKKNRILVRIIEHNIPSIKIAESAGFVLHAKKENILIMELDNASLNNRS